MRTLTKIGFILTAFWLGVFAVIGLSTDTSRMGLNEWGDFLAGVSAPLALLWLVIGYFQQGDELRLNTKALDAQKEELRRQAEETRRLAEIQTDQAEATLRFAESQEKLAAATERMWQLSEAEAERQRQQRISEAKPLFVGHGGVAKTNSSFTTNVSNLGGDIRNVSARYSGPYLLKLEPEVIWQHGANGRLTFASRDGSELQFPIEFHILYMDRLGGRGSQLLRFTRPHVMEETPATD